MTTFSSTVCESNSKEFITSMLRPSWRPMRAPITVGGENGEGWAEEPLRATEEAPGAKGLRAGALRQRPRPLRLSPGAAAGGRVGGTAGHGAPTHLARGAPPASASGSSGR